MEVYARLPLQLRRVFSIALRKFKRRNVVSEPQLTFLSKPKGAKQDKPKSAVKTAANGKSNGTANNDRTRTEKNKTGRAGKPKRKTAEELDAEMEDYFGGGPVNGNTNGAAAGVDQEMDEVL